MESRKMPDWNNQLQNLENAMVEDILSMSDEEVLTEVREDGGDPPEIAGAMIRIFEVARVQCRGER